MIEVNHLSFTYPGATFPALNQMSFSIGQGEIFGLLGPSGAGKSTTQKILIGALRRYEGEVRVNGLELGQVSRDYYEQIGVAFEFPNFYNRLTALENLNLFRSLYKKAAGEPLDLLGQVGLAEAAAQKVGSFSKGMRMRLNLCRALLHEPKVLFLDEPTSGLDPVNARLVKDIIRARQAAGATVVLTTHNMAAAEELCDRVAFIVDGSIKVLDTPLALKLGAGERLLDVTIRDEQGQSKSLSFAMQGLESNEAFMQLLRDNSIERMHTREVSLEQLFIDMTGRRLQ